jgi:hypothetical protein
VGQTLIAALSFSAEGEAVSGVQFDIEPGLDRRKRAEIANLTPSRWSAGRI